MPPADFSEKRISDSVRVLCVRGELDISNATELRGAIDSALSDGVTAVVVDLSELEHMDSSALAALVWAHKRLDEAGGGPLAVAVGQGHLQAALGLKGLHAVFTLAETVDEALAAVEARAPGS